jgi:hypothetical protein
MYADDIYRAMLVFLLAVCSPAAQADFYNNDPQPNEPAFTHEKKVVPQLYELTQRVQEQKAYMAALRAEQIKLAKKENAHARSKAEQDNSWLYGEK